MSGHFEVDRWDGAGRLGTLSVPRAGSTVRTPALMPVVNPNLQTIAPAALADDFGAQILITNAYIIHGDDDLREAALEQGLEEMLGFPGVIMTDSGSYQLAEYGDIDVTSDEILAFQEQIGSHIGTPVDIPTPPDVPRERASEELAETTERLERAVDLETGDMLVSGPVQGSTYPDLRERAGRRASEIGCDVHPVGGVVPLLNDYRYADVVDAVVGAKRGLGPATAVHLFGAGHPMMFALAVAAGCDLFDSAAYALYAREGRYLTVAGTRSVSELEELPCSCSVCSGTDGQSLREYSEEERHRALASHNLAVSFAELRRVRDAIRNGTLLELVDRRARSHPAMVEGYRRLLEYDEYLERTDPVSGGTMLYCSGESARRPEVSRYHRRLERLAVPESLVVGPGSGDREHWHLRPPFGPVPPALARTYPLTAAVPETPDRPALEAAADGVRTLAAANPGTDLTVVAADWPDSALERLPPAVTVRERD